jgi:hypothetical protein
MFAASQAEVIPKEKATIKAKKVMLTIFVNGVSLITSNALASGAQFNQEYFTMTYFLRLLESKGDFCIDFPRANFCAHRQFHDRKMTDELDDLKLDRVPDPPYSPALSRCDFWIFGMLEQTIKDQVFRCILAISQGIG